MTRVKGILLALLLSGFAAHLWAGTYTAASCSYANVNAVINGPTHAAAAGDTIVIPAGICTWTSSLTITVGITLIGNGTQNTTSSTFGAGTTNTVLVDNYASGPMISGQGIAYGQTLRISTLDIEPESGSTPLSSPLAVAGSCSSSGCPNLRIDNIGFGITTQWTEAGNSSSAQTMIRLDNVFGVLDHITLPNGSSCSLANVSHSAYLGVGANGDNSWAQADSFGGTNNIFIENNLLYTNQWLVDQEFAPTGGGEGGGRYVGRFNKIFFPSGALYAFGTHGLDTSGRPRSGRQITAYGNTVSCTNGSCNGLVTHRGGTGFIFGNTLEANYSVTGGFWGNVDSFAVYRTVFASSPWGYCGGLNSLDPWDTNDNTVYYTGKVTTAATLTMTDTSKSFTTNQLIPTGAPYSVYDTTQGFVAEIASNTSDTITVDAPISESGWAGFNNGDSYEIIRSRACVDQAGRGAGIYVSGSTPSPSSAMSEVSDPIYEWDDTAQNLNHGNIASQTLRVIANRDWYTDNSNGSPQAQTSSTSPFNGTSGVGFGTLARRPTTCAPSVGYFATDQGGWNTSGNGFGSGELFVCTATNTWSLYYTPYTYPHPLSQGTGTSAPTPPTNLEATAH